MNYKKWYTLAAYIIVIILLSVIQITFLGNFGPMVAGINLGIIGLVLLINLFDFHQAIIFVLMFGFILDVYSGLPFGIFLLSLFFTAVSLELIFFNLLTNRSYYSLIAMGLVAIVFYNVYFYLVTGFLYIIGVSNFSLRVEFWWSMMYQLVSALVILTLFFWIINKISNKFKPMFLRS